MLKNYLYIVLNLYILLLFEADLFCYQTVAKTLQTVYLTADQDFRKFCVFWNKLVVFYWSLYISLCTGHNKIIIKSMICLTLVGFFSLFQLLHFFPFSLLSTISERNVSGALREKQKQKMEIEYLYIYSWLSKTFKKSLVIQILN